MPHRHSRRRTKEDRPGRAQRRALRVAQWLCSRWPHATLVALSPSLQCGDGADAALTLGAVNLVATCLASAMDATPQATPTPTPTPASPSVPAAHTASGIIELDDDDEAATGTTTGASVGDARRPAQLLELAAAMPGTCEQLAQVCQHYSVHQRKNMYLWSLQCHCNLTLPSQHASRG